MSTPASVLQFRRVPALLRLLALLLASATLALAPAAASAQSIVPDVQTKEQAEQAQKAAEEAASTTSTGSDNSLEIGLVVLALVMLVGAAWWILHDSSDAVGDERRAAPGRPLDPQAVGRGAPKAMFTGEGEPGGKTGKRKKREQGRRQRQARKANRPR